LDVVVESVLEAARPKGPSRRLIMAMAKKAKQAAPKKAAKPAAKKAAPKKKK